MRSADPPKPSGSRPWLLGDAQGLANAKLARHGFSAANYGTERWLVGDPDAPRWGRLFADQSNEGPLLEQLSPEVWHRYEALGVRPATPDGLQPALSDLRGALSLLEEVADVGATALPLVMSIHLIRSSGPGYDVSHSDPSVPCSIFLSVPTGERHAILRVAESILHEAMHLQLTLVEERWPLVRDGQDTVGFSPWQLRERPLSGLVHGLYVFAAIDRFMEEASGLGRLDGAAQSFAAKRRAEISSEIAQVAHIADSPDLTEFGRTLASTLIGDAVGGQAAKAAGHPSFAR